MNLYVRGNLGKANIVVHSDKVEWEAIYGFYIKSPLPKKKKHPHNMSMLSRIGKQF